MRHLYFVLLSSALALLHSNQCHAFHLKRPLQTTLQQASTTFLSVLRDLSSTRTLQYEDNDDEKNNSNAFQQSRLSFTQLLEQTTQVKQLSSRKAAVHTEFVAEADLPTDLGFFRMRGYSLQPSHPVLEPCVIYAAGKAPFGDGPAAENVPVRIHDQCLTSEVFGSLR